MSEARICVTCDLETDAERCAKCQGSTLPVSLFQEEDEGLGAGEIIGGRYRVEGTLGEGAFGMVYLATHLDLGQFVAIKTLKKRFLTNKQFLKRFFREAQSVSRLNHPNLVKVYDFGNDSERGFPYLVMERLEGSTLQDYLEAHDTLPVGEACDLMAEVARGLVAAHRRGIIHRDLKPENIWLRALPDGFMEVKILDFGIAKALVDGDSTMLTEAGMVIGSPTFMSPEQILAQAVDARTDLYALGCMLFLSLSGTLPFDADDRRSLLAMHLHDERPALPNILCDGNAPSAALAQLQSALFSRDKENRPASARVVAELLRQLAQGLEPDVATELAEATPEEIVPFKLDKSPPPAVANERQSPRKIAPTELAHPDHFKGEATGPELASGDSSPVSQKGSSSSATIYVVATMIVLALGLGLAWHLELGPFGTSLEQSRATLNRQGGVSPSKEKAGQVLSEKVGPKAKLDDPSTLPLGVLGPTFEAHLKRLGTTGVSGLWGKEESQLKLVLNPSMKLSMEDTRPWEAFFRAHRDKRLKKAKRPKSGKRESYLDYGFVDGRLRVIRFWYRYSVPEVAEKITAVLGPSQPLEQSGRNALLLWRDGATAIVLNRYKRGAVLRLVDASQFEQMMKRIAVAKAKEKVLSRAAKRLKGKGANLLQARQILIGVRDSPLADLYRCRIALNLGQFGQAKSLCLNAKRHTISAKVMTDAAYRLGITALIEGRREDGVAKLQEAKGGKRFDYSVYDAAYKRLWLLEGRSQRKASYRKALVLALKRELCFKRRGWPRGEFVHKEFGFSTPGALQKALEGSGIGLESHIAWAKKHCFPPPTR